MTGNPIVFVPSEMMKHGYFNDDGTLTQKGVQAIAYYHQAKHGVNILSPFKSPR